MTRQEIKDSIPTWTEAIEKAVRWLYAGSYKRVADFKDGQVSFYILVDDDCKEALIDNIEVSLDDESLQYPEEFIIKL